MNITFAPIREYSHEKMIGACNKRNIWLFNELSKVCKDKIVLDIGTGSGILSFMALYHGAKHVYMVDVNPEFIEAAKYNLEKNNIPKEKYTLIEGLFTKDILENLPGPDPDVVVSETVSGEIFDQVYGPWSNFCHIINESHINPIIIPNYASGSFYLLPGYVLENGLKARIDRMKTGIKEFDNQYALDGDYKYEEYKRMDSWNQYNLRYLRTYTFDKIVSSTPCLKDIVKFDAYAPVKDLTWKMRSSLPNKKYTAMFIAELGRKKPITVGSNVMTADSGVPILNMAGECWPTWYYEFNKTTDNVVVRFDKEKNTFFILSEKI